MAAYAAVISLKHTIHRLLNSSRISILSSSREILEFAYNEVKSLQGVLERLDDSSSSSMKRVNALDRRTTEAVHKLEDVLEFHESDQFFSSHISESCYGDDGSSRILSIDLEEVREEIHSLVNTVKKMEEEYIQELDNPSALPEEEEDDEAVSWSSSIDFGVEMVGLSDEFAKIKNHMLQRMRPDDFVSFPILGPAGSGRTAIAKAVFDELYIGKEQSFDCGAWVTIGPEYQFKEILLRILAQIDDHKLLVSEGDDEKNVAEYLYTSLRGRRYMIVLDDIWDTHTWLSLTRCFPEQNNGSLVLFTTGQKAVSDLPSGFYSYPLGVLPEDFVWELLRCAMFGYESCPPEELEEAGKKIARNSRGYLLPFIKVILLLWKVNNMPEYWNKLAADKKNPIFMVVDELSEICKIKEDIQQLYNSNLDDNQRQFLNDIILRVLDLSHAVKQIKMHLFPKRYFHKMEIISFYGMAGIGKTTFVKKIFEDPSILPDIDHRAWITLGPKYQPEEILVDILAQIYPNIDKRHMKEDLELTKVLCTKLSLKRCLIVFDDVRNKKLLYCLKKLFPDIKGKALVTTRLAKVAQFEQYDKVHEVHLLNKDESWCLFCQKAFVKGLCPPELEKAGKKISENCEGLPLLILIVSDLLSKDKKTPEYWNKVAEKQNSVFMNAQNEMSKALFSSYNSLPYYLKACFLYMGVFPQNYEIYVSKFINLLNAEGFLEPDSCKNIEDFVVECLLELTNRSLVMVCQMSSNFKVKTYRLHCVFWHLSNNKAVKSMFFHALNIHTDNSIQDIKRHHRLCIRNSILLGIIDIHNSMASISSTHSLLCNGQFHQYQVPLCFDLRLLRVMDALTIRLCEFPIEIVKLIHLRYIALTCNGKLPASISKLWYLQYLIVSRYLSIKSSDNSSFLPAEIWDMKESKHLQIMGGRLPNPNCGVILPNLLTLLDVSPHSCTKTVFKGIPNLKRLGIQIELAPDGYGNPFHCMNDILHLHKLESLKCVVVNPELRSEVVIPLARSMFFSSLKKLSLSGLGYPWEYTSIIGQLHNLEVLKLRCFAFQGPEWKTDYNHFIEVKFLSIEDTDLERWKIKLGTFPKLKHLSMKHCYKLNTLPLPYHFPHLIEKIEIVDCNPLAVTWAKQMKEKPNKRSKDLEFLKVHSSWDADSLKQ